MQEGVLLESDIHKGGLEAILQVLDHPLVDAPDNPFFRGMLNLELLQLAVLEHRHAGFEALGIDHNLTLETFPSKPESKH